MRRDRFYLRVWMVAGLVVVTGCQSPPEIRVLQATYGVNCDVARGNATEPVAAVCDRRGSCQFRVEVGVLGDPALGCSKAFEAVWRCPGEDAVRRATVPPESGYGSVVFLACDR